MSHTADTVFTLISQMMSGDPDAIDVIDDVITEGVDGGGVLFQRKRFDRYVRAQTSWIRGQHLRGLRRTQFRA